MATTMSLSQFLKILVPPGSSFPMWQEHLMACLESAESINELNLRTHLHSEVKRRLYALRTQNRRNLIDGRAARR